MIKKNKESKLILLALALILNIPLIDHLPIKYSIFNISLTPLVSSVLINISATINFFNASKESNNKLQLYLRLSFIYIFFFGVYYGFNYLFIKQAYFFITMILSIYLMSLREVREFPIIFLNFLVFINFLDSILFLFDTGFFRGSDELWSGLWDVNFMVSLICVWRIVLSLKRYDESHQLIDLVFWVSISAFILLINDELTAFLLAVLVFFVLILNCRLRILPKSMSLQCALIGSFVFWLCLMILCGLMLYAVPAEEFSSLRHRMLLWVMLTDSMDKQTLFLGDGIHNQSVLALDLAKDSLFNSLFLVIKNFGLVLSNVARTISSHSFLFDMLWGVGIIGCLLLMLFWKAISVNIISIYQAALFFWCVGALGFVSLGGDLFSALLLFGVCFASLD